tara:strand:+ start:17 stop:421 length:405 start_codon:yes stop_codon:yes gene_type:complete
MTSAIHSGRKAIEIPLPVSASLLATAERDPVAPEELSSSWCTDMEMPTASGGGKLEASKDWVMPEGSVHVAEDEKPCAVTSMQLATVVVTLGAVCVKEEEFDWLSNTSTIVPVFASRNAVKPPADPVDVENTKS